MQTSDSLETFEAAVSDLMTAFDVVRPPVPVELMLQRPRPGMWNEVNLSELSMSFINVMQRHSPRMSVARLLARHVCRSVWGEQHGLHQFADSEDDVRALARAIVMPRAMIAELPPAVCNPLDISSQFEVPEEDARLRLNELGYAVA